MAATSRADDTASHTPGVVGATPTPAPETRDNRRYRRELERLLQTAHCNLDARGVPRISHRDDAR